MRKVLGFVTLTLLLAGTTNCGSDESLCEKVGKAVCAKACSCREGPTCGLSEGAATFDFESESDCKILLVTLGCSNSENSGYKDAAACLPLVEAGTCTGTGTEAAFSYPTEMACSSTQSD